MSEEYPSEEYCGWCGRVLVGGDDFGAMVCARCKREAAEELPQKEPHALADAEEAERTFRVQSQSLNTTKSYVNTG